MRLFRSNQSRWERYKYKFLLLLVLMLAFVTWLSFSNGLMRKLGSLYASEAQETRAKTTMVAQSVVLPSQHSPAGAQALTSPDLTVSSAVPAAVINTGKMNPASVVDEFSSVAPDQQVAQEVQRWSKAWSTQDVAIYLSMYSRQFVPSDAKTRSAWESERRLRILSKKKIVHTVSNLEIRFDGPKAIVKFEQSYAADRMELSQTKIMTWLKEEGRWRIASEAVAQ